MIDNPYEAPQATSPPRPSKWPLRIAVVATLLAMVFCLAADLAISTWPYQNFELFIAITFAIVVAGASTCTWLEHRYRSKVQEYERSQ
jgi:uncharacterized membrane protein YoaK (UPF0700 family)